MTINVRKINKTPIYFVVSIKIFNTMRRVTCAEENIDYFSTLLSGNRECWESNDKHIPIITRGRA